MPHVKSRIRNATNSDDCPHDASVCSSHHPLDGINLLRITFRLLFTKLMLLNWVQMQLKTSLFINQLIEDLIERL